MGQEPVLQYKMYEGNYIDSFNSANTLENADQYTNTVTDRHGTANRAIDLNSSNVPIRVDS